MSHSKSKKQVTTGLPIEFHPKVIDFMESLDARAQAKSVRTQGMLVEQGLALGLPHIKKIHSNLWELIVDCSGLFIRYFITIRSGQFVIVHAYCKKTNKTPQREIDLAARRANE